MDQWVRLSIRQLPIVAGKRRKSILLKRQCVNINRIQQPIWKTNLSKPGEVRKADSVQHRVSKSSQPDGELGEHEEMASIFTSMISLPHSHLSR